MSDKLNRELLMELGEAEDKCRSISVGGAMFDESILSQPPTPQALVEVLGWSTDGQWVVSVTSMANEHNVWLGMHYRRVLWMLSSYDDEPNSIYIPSIPTLRDVVDLCRLLGIPCEVKRC